MYNTAYKTTEINTADRVRIISLMYDGAVNFINLAKEKLLEGDVAGKGLYTGKATAIIGELASSLNMEAGGEIAKNLKMLYDYILDRLLYANLNSDKNSYDEAIRVLNIIREGWKEMEKKQQASVKPAEVELSTGVRV
ncbi:MAG TPA: flagellar export chaperone FliS [Nitrospirae bacterium]|nr:flagellar export chaperone FliS [Nitrospirota bacterium]